MHADRLDAALDAVLRAAARAKADGELPYAAAIVLADGSLVGPVQDRVARDRDPTRHGELEVVRLAVAGGVLDLRGAALVSNVEPCGMCFGAAWWAGVGTVAFALGMRDLMARRSDAMPDVFVPVDVANATLARPVEVLRFGPALTERAWSQWLPAP